MAVVETLSSRVASSYGVLNVWADSSFTPGVRPVCTTRPMAQEVVGA
jgi:hypothetical protein